MADIVKIPKGQPFVLYIPLVILNADGSKDAVDASSLSDVSVSLLNACDELSATFYRFEHFLVLDLPQTLNTGEYATVITATLSGGRLFTLRIKRAFGVVNWDSESNWRDYIVGDHIELADQPFIAGIFNTDAEYDALKEQLRAAIAAAEQAKADADAAKAEYDRKAEMLDGVAQEETLREGVEDIRTDISHIDIDTSDLAKETTLGTPLVGQPNTIFAAIAALAQGDDSKQAIVDAINQMGGSATTSMTWTQLAQQIESLQVYSSDVVFSSTTPRPINIASVMLQGAGIKKIYTDAPGTILNWFAGVADIEEINFAGATIITPLVLNSNNTNLVKFAAPNVTSRAGTNDIISGVPNLQEIDLRSIQAINSYAFRNNSNIRKFNLLNCGNAGIVGTSFSNTSNLIDLIIGQRFYGNAILTAWAPEQALRSDTYSLLTDEDLDAGFTNNLQKLLYNIREHIAANLPQLTNEGYSITFNASVKAAIQADTATSNAFTSKGWTIA